MNKNNNNTNNEINNTNIGHSTKIELIDFTITTPTNRVYSKKVFMINVKTIDGDISVRNGHIPTIMQLSSGAISIYDVNSKIDKSSCFFVYDGFIKITTDEVTIITSRIFEDFDKEEILKRIEFLNEKLKDIVATDMKQSIEIKNEILLCDKKLYFISLIG